jgi:ATP-dependent DNA helicase RecG
MKTGEKKDVIGKFRDGSINILVTTPVIEVGIDIPTADIILIEAAERFGLAQLHQLRGRVGRGEKESYCLLYSGSGSDKTRKRLAYLQTVNDGAELAEIDLKIRGPGEMFGTMQHGIPDLKIASLSNIEIVKSSKVAAEKIFPELSKHPALAGKIAEVDIPKISKD